MRLGIGSYTYVWSVGVPGYAAPSHPLTPLELLARAAELGVSVVQIADRMPLHRLDERELVALRDAAEQRNLTLELGTVGIGPEHLRRYAEIATLLRARLIRTIIDTETERPSPNTATAQLAAIAPELADRGVVLAIENHERRKVRALREIIERVAHPSVGVCLDTANSLGSSEGPSEVLDILGPFAHCLHLKDYTARRLPHQFGFQVEGCAAGAGDVDIPQWLGQLQALGRDVNVIIELWPAPEADLATTIAKENRWAAESVANLRRFVGE